MLPFVGNDLLQDGYARLIPQRLELLAIFGDIPTLVDLQPAKSKVSSADPIRQGVGLPGQVSGILRLRLSEFPNALSPQVGMMLLCSRQTQQRIPAMGIYLLSGQGTVGIVTFHLGLPVCF